jgi:serine protease Do
MSKEQAAVMKRNYIGWAAIGISTAALVSSQNWSRNLPAAPQESVVIEGLEQAKAVSLAFQSVAKAVSPSVVLISVKQKAPAGLQGLAPGGRDGQRQMTPDDMREFMERFRRMLPEGVMPEEGFKIEPQQFEAQGTGSGFVYDDKGHILTNNHVVEGASEDGIQVGFSDGTVLPAKVVGTDPKTDVAVIKIEPSDAIRPLRIGASEDATVGEWVLAIGSPFGLEQTVTTGIVSATHRDAVGILGQGGYEDFLQTDASINPGNSGGPLVNIEGEVIGINSAIASRTGRNQGVGFAIPIDLAKHVADSLIRDGKVTRGLMGVRISELNAKLAKSFGVDLKSTGGILIEDVVADMPADKAGVKSGDVLVEFDGQPVRSMADFRWDVATSPVNKPLDLTIVRGGKKQTIQVTLKPEEEVERAYLASSPGRARPEPSKPATTENFKDFGLELGDLSADEASALGFDAKQKGVLIKEVADGSAAATAGLEPGLVITGVVKDHKVQPVLDVDGLLKIAGDRPRSLALQVLTGDGSSQFVALDLED